MKICILSRYQNIINRGVETYVLELSKRLSIDHCVDVLTGKDSDSFIRLIKENYDIIIPTNGRLQALKASTARLFTKSKVIISGQAGIGKDDIWNIAVTMPDVYVAITNYEMQWAKKWNLASKITKITNGADLNRFSPKGIKKDFEVEAPVFLSVGALEWYKHHELSIKAVAKLQKGSLVIIGSGPEKEKLENLGNQLLGEQRFKIISSSYTEIDQYYRSANAFLLPSWIRESFGIVYVEAMASGLPIVAPDDSPRREIIGNAGIFVAVSDSVKYSQGLEEVLKKDWKNIPQKQAEKFSWDKIALQYKALFQEIMND